MSELDQQQLQAQTDLLREIREELRATRGMSASAGSGGMSGGAARPGHTFVAAQAAADRTLLGGWNSFGWSAAYSSNYHSTLFGDLSALVGFNRAPQTLTQNEFRSLAGQNISARAGNFAVGMIAPGYVASTNALADDIFRNSSRFVRFGNPNAGVMGTGLDYNVARSISRGIHTEALGDLRMSGTDYSTITSLGMQSGQFDQAGGVDDFKKRVRELASATGDLTRALHMTVSEVGTAMGNLKQMGVTSIAAQRSIMMQVGGSAMVAGMSSPEMMQFSGSMGQAGNALGLNAATTMPAAAQTLALVRSMSQSGALSPNILAMGGGAANIAGQIVGAEMRYSASNAGYLSSLGGGGQAGANSIFSTMRGMSRAGLGTFEGAVTMGMDRFQNQQNMTPEQMEMNMRNMFETNMRMAGIKDVTSHAARGMAFQMAHNFGMDDAASFAFAQANFSSGGRQASDIARIQSARAAASREQALTLDNLQLATSWKGRFRAGMQNVEAGAAGMADSAMNTIDLMTGTNSFQSYQAGLNARLLGGGGDLSLEQLLSGGADSSSQPVANAAITSLHIRNRDGGSTRGIVGTVATVGATALLASNPLGWGTAAVIAAGTAVAGAGSVGTSIWASDNYSEVKDQLAIQDMLTVNAAIAHSGSSTAVQKAVSSGILNGMTTTDIFKRFQNRGALNGADLQAITPMILKGAKDAKVTPEVYVSGLNMGGLNIRQADIAEESSTGATAVGMKAIESIMSGISSVGSASSSSPEGAGAMASYIDRVLSGNSETDVALNQKVRGALGSDEAFNQFTRRVGNMAAPAARQSGWSYYGSIPGYNTDLPDGRKVLSEASTAYKAHAKTATNAAINSLLAGGIGLAKTSLEISGLSADKKKLYADALDNPNTNFLTMLKSGDFADSAAAGAFGQGGILQEVAKIGRSSDFTRRNGESADDEAMRLSHKFHIAGLTGARVNGSTPEQLRAALMESKLMGGQVGKENAADQPALVAASLRETKDALVKLNRELDQKVTKPKEPQ